MIKKYVRAACNKRVVLWRTMANLRSVLVAGAFHANESAELDALELMAVPAADAFLLRIAREGRQEGGLSALGAAERVRGAEVGLSTAPGLLRGSQR
jgi:hypothetical protein